MAIAPNETADIKISNMPIKWVIIFFQMLKNAGCAFILKKSSVVCTHVFLTCFYPISFESFIAFFKQTR
jgi:hypothetical protein